MLRKIALTLTIIGALNWGVFALFKFDVVAELMNGQSVPFARFIYLLIGVSALYTIGLLVRIVYRPKQEMIRSQ